MGLIADFKMTRTPQKILVIATRRIGDVLLTTPLFRAIRNAYPNAILDVVVLKGTEGILEGNPDISHIIATSERPDGKEYRTLISKLWRKYDLAVTTLAGDRPSLFAIIAAKNRIGALHHVTTKHAWKRMLFKRWVKLNDQRWHIVLQNKQFADELGIENSTEVVPPYATESKDKIRALTGFSTETTNYVILHPYPMWPYKQLSDSSWEHIGGHLRSQNYQVILSGGSAKAELDVCAALHDKIEGSINLAGKTRFTDIAELLGNAALFVGPDTSITHLAAACGTPTLAVYGPTSPVRWGPWPKDFDAKGINYSPYEKVKHLQQLGNVWLYQPQRSCIPCQEEGCDKHRYSESLCLKEIPDEHLLNLCDAILGHDRG